MPINGHIHFHSPCFDGVVSAVLAWDVLEIRSGWGDCELHPVNYAVRGTWLSGRLPDNSAVVDFMYHPDTVFFADHHLSSFLNPEHERTAADGDRTRVLYDSTAESCAELIWSHYREDLIRAGRNHSALVKWASKIDAARYESVREALFSTAPALRISSALSVSPTGTLSSEVVRLLRKQPLDVVAQNPEVVAAFQTARASLEEGLDHLARTARVDAHGVVTFDVDARGVVVNRYSPYHLFPRARYSAGIIRGDNDAKIVVMRNPWMEFQSAPVGAICERFGGGGHHRVGAIVLRGERVADAASILQQIVSELETADVRERRC